MAIHWPTTLLIGDRRQACTIVDVSRAGARVRLTEPVAPKTHIALVDERVGALEATVAWCRGDTAGVAFRQLAPDVAARFRAVLAALERAEAESAAQRPRPQFGRRTHPG